MKIISRAPFVAYQAGGKQEFPSDPIAWAVREREARAAGKVKVRRIPRAPTPNFGNVRKAA